VLERLSGFERRPIEQEAAMPIKREAMRTEYQMKHAEAVS